MKVLDNSSIEELKVIHLFKNGRIDMKRLLIHFFLISMISLSITGDSFFNKQKYTEENQEQVTQEKCVKEDTNEEMIERSADKSEKSKKLVVIDPGHGNHSNMEKEKQSPDSNVMKIKDGGGAKGVVTKTPEYVVNMKVALKLKSLLEKNNMPVIMTKTSDSESPGNIERAEIANKNNAALEIRIHCDSAGNSSAKGASMLVPAKSGYAVPISEVSKKYGQAILNKVVQTCGMNNRGVIERSDITGFNWSKVPVVLVEMGFMSNREEDKLLSDDSYQNKLAEGLSAGIVEALSK